MSGTNSEFYLLGEPSNPFAIMTAEGKEKYPFLFEELRNARVGAPITKATTLPDGSAEPDVVAWYFAKERRHPVVTRFLVRKGLLFTEKSLLGSQAATVTLFFPDGTPLLWRQCSESYLPEPKFVLLWRSGGKSAFAMLQDYLSWAISQYEISPGLLKGESLDAIATNAVIKSPYALFDQEWVCGKPIRTSYFILRNLLALSWKTEGKPLPVAQSYFKLCEELNVAPRLADDIAMERDLQRTTSINPIPDGPTELLLSLFSKPVKKRRRPIVLRAIASLARQTLRQIKNLASKPPTTAQSNP